MANPIARVGEDATVALLRSSVATAFAMTIVTAVAAENMFVRSLKPLWICAKTQMCYERASNYAAYYCYFLFHVAFMPQHKAS